MNDAHGQIADLHQRAVIALPEAQVIDIIEGMSDALYVIDDHWRISYVNRTAEELCGRSRAELLGENIWEVFPQSVGTQAYHAYVDAMRERQAIAFDYLSPVDQRWYAVRAHPNGGGLVVYFNDITDRKVAEEALRKQKEILQTIFDHIPVMIRFLSADGRVDLVNRAWEQTLGWSLQEVQHQGFALFEHLYPDPHERQRALAFVAAATGAWADFRICVRDGRMRDMTFTNMRLPDGTNLSIGQDITERKRVEEMLCAAQMHTESILSSVADIHILFDRQWRYQYVNPAAARAIGRSSDQILGRTLWELYPDIIGTALHLQYQRAMDERVPVTFEFYYATLDTWWDNRFYPVTEGLAVFATDITARKYAEIEQTRLFEQLQRLSHQLLQAHEAERRSIARELHDEIGQQLSGLGMLLSTVTSQLPSDAIQTRLAKAVSHVRDLIEQVRNLALDLRPAILDDFGLVSALVWLFERYTMQMHIAVRFEHRLHEQRFAPDVETTAYRIVQEALTNVARHAGVAQATVRLWIDGDSLAVLIADQGCGFDPQASRTRHSIGLAGMAERAALLGGVLTIESASGAGTRVTARVPLGNGSVSLTQEHE